MGALRIQAAQAAVEGCFSTERRCDFSSTLMSTFISFVSDLPGTTEREMNSQGSKDNLGNLSVEMQMKNHGLAEEQYFKLAL